MADDWYYRSSDSQHGPMSFAALRELAANGALRPDHTVRTGTEGAWKFADSIPQLFPLRNKQSAADISETAQRESVDSSRDGLAFRNVEACTSTPELWFYKLDDRTHGPISLDALLRLAAVSGETARDIVVRQNDGEAWQSLDNLDDSPTTSPRSRPREHESIDAAARAGFPAAAPLPRRSGLKRPHSVVERAIGRVRRNTDMAVAAILLIALNAILLAAMRPPLAQERKYFESLRSIYDDLRTLEALKTSPDQWSDFRTRAEGALAPIIKDLEKSADASHPIRQHLLWAGRDNLAEMLSRVDQPAHNPMTMDEDRLHFEQHMKWLEAAFAEQGR